MGKSGCQKQPPPPHGQAQGPFITDSSGAPKIILLPLIIDALYMVAQQIAVLSGPKPQGGDERR